MVTVVTSTAPPKAYSYSSKANAIKEVETWASDLGGSTRDSAVRSVGQIVDNVTEGRLLRTKVMELSKERYKFLVQSDYDKKFFVEAQQRKLRAMPDLLRGVDVEYWLSKKPRRRRRARTVLLQLQSAASAAAAAAAAQAHETAVAVADPRSKAAAAVGLKETPPRDDAIRRECITPAPPASSCAARGSPRGGSAMAPHRAPRRVATSLGVAPTSSASPPPQSRPKSPEWARASTDLQPLQLQRRRQTLASIAVGPSLAGAAAKTQPSTAAAGGARHNHDAAAAAALGSRPTEGGGGGGVRAGRDARRAVADIRYVKLEGSLADSYACESPMEVSAIVDGCRALHVPSAAGTRYMKPKLSGHIAEYLRQRKLIA